MSWKLDKFDEREVSFNVYRSQSQNFDEGDDSLIAEDIDAGSLHFIDSQILEDGTYFYKICVKDRDSGNMLAATDEKEVTVAGLGDSFSSKTD